MNKKGLGSCLFLFLLLFNGIFVMEMGRNNLVDETPIHDVSNEFMMSGGYNPSFIYIDGSILNNWSNTALNNDWCKGAGLQNDPYIIENCTIDATGSPTGSGIFINNSQNVYFIVRNCSVVNSGSGFEDAGIKLENSNNGTIYNNSLINNGASGILLISSKNNTLHSNQATLNTQNGILLKNSSNNLIINNSANGNLVFGFQLTSYSNYNRIEMNNISENTQYGVALILNCFNNTIFNNTINMNLRTGIGIFSYCDNNTILNNTINGNLNYGIELNSNNKANIFVNNTIQNSGIYGIQLFSNCTRNIIQDNTIINSGVLVQGIGIFLRKGCDNNKISRNFVKSSKIGILLLDQSNHNEVNNNTIRDNDMGVFDTTCNYNFLYQNDISGSLKDNPIFIDGSLIGPGARNWNWAKNQGWCSGSGTLMDPYLIKNLDIDGLSFDLFNCIEIYNSTAYFIVEGCFLNDSNQGILLQNVNNGQLVNNTCINNHNSGINLGLNSAHNIIENNIITKNHEFGLYLDSGSKDNTILYNQIFNNYIDGLAFRGNSQNNTIKYNEIYGNIRHGISLEISQNNYFLFNVIFQNPQSLIGESSESGIFCTDNSDNNQFISNWIYNNWYGLFFSNCQANLIYNNCISYNYLNNAVDDGINNWFYFFIGNYWSNYTGPDVAEDGIGDIPHEIPGTGNRTDNKPLMDFFVRYILTASDITYEIGTSGHVLRWFVFDNSPMLMSYRIFKNELLIDSGWVINVESEITTNVDGLAEGSYIYKIEIRHGVGENSSRTVCVKVINTEPSFIIQPNNISFQFGDTGNVLKWRFYDISTNYASYSIRKNGILIVPETACSSGTDIDLNIDWLTPGTYSFIIQINDGYGKIISSEVIVTVKGDEKEPLFTSSDLIIIIVGSIIAGVIIVSEFLIYRKILKQQREFQALISQKDKNLKKSNASTRDLPKQDDKSLKTEL